MSKAVIPGMKAAGQGRIVNMTSVAAHNGGGPGASIYRQQSGRPELYQGTSEGARFKRS